MIKKCRDWESHPGFRGHNARYCYYTISAISRARACSYIDAFHTHNSLNRCKGTNGQLTPDFKNPHETFDTTVDKLSDPTIFVAYHDAQVYPEYLLRYMP